MDPDLWGNLQHHISLENVYLKLPLREFFQLRGVCKRWNRLACQRRCPTNGTHKPYFVIAYPGTMAGIPHHTRILTFHIPSGLWRWKREYVLVGHQLYPPSQPFSVEGLVFGVETVRGYSLFSHKVYDFHTKEICWISLLPNMTGRPCAVGMVVDNCVMPHTFKVIYGSLHDPTQIYHSTTRSLEARASLVPAGVLGRRALYKSCSHCDDQMYIWSHVDTILVYSLKEDIWSTLNPPPRQENDCVGIALGSWEGQVFAVMEDGGMLSITIWQLVNRSEQVWKRFAHVPSELQEWLVPPSFQTGDTIRAFADFCHEYVLIHTLLARDSGRGGDRERNVLFHLVSEQWEKMDVSNPDNFDGPSGRRVNAAFNCSRFNL